MSCRVNVLYLKIFSANNKMLTSTLHFEQKAPVKNVLNVKKKEARGQLRRSTMLSFGYKLSNL